MWITWGNLWKERNEKWRLKLRWILVPTSESGKCEEVFGKDKRVSRGRGEVLTRPVRVRGDLSMIVKWRWVVPTPKTTNTNLKGERVCSTLGGLARQFLEAFLNGLDNNKMQTFISPINISNKSITWFMVILLLLCCIVDVAFHKYNLLSKVWFCYL